MKKSQWAIIFAEPTEKHPAPENYRKFIGSPVLNGGRHDPGDKTPKLFSLRSEAQAFANKFVEKYGFRWNVIVKKWDPRVPPNPYQVDEN